MASFPRGFPNEILRNLDRASKDENTNWRFRKFILCILFARKGQFVYLIRALVPCLIATSLNILFWIMICGESFTIKLYWTLIWRGTSHDLNKKKIKSYVMFFRFRFKPKLDHTISWNTSQLVPVTGSEIFIAFFAWNRVSLTYAWKSIMNDFFLFIL